jgi:hypothetical protein
MDESSEPAVIFPTEFPQQQSRPLRRKISHQSTPTFSAFVRTPSGRGGRFLTRYNLNFCLINYSKFFL